MGIRNKMIPWIIAAALLGWMVWVSISESATGKCYIAGALMNMTPEQCLSQGGLVCESSTDCPEYPECEVCQTCEECPPQTNTCDQQKLQQLYEILVQLEAEWRTILVQRHGNKLATPDDIHWKIRAGITTVLEMLKEIE